MFISECFCCFEIIYILLGCIFRFFCDFVELYKQEIFLSVQRYKRYYKMNDILFCVSKFKKDNLPLQPWLTIYVLSKIFIKKGYPIHVLTDSKSVDNNIEGINIHYVSSLRGYNHFSIEEKIRNIEPEFVFVSVTPISLLFNSWYKILQHYKSYCLASYPFYQYSDIYKSFFQISLLDKIRYGKNIFIKSSWWSFKLSKYFCGFICQSECTKKNIEKKINKCIDVHFVPPGIKSTLCTLSTNKKNGKETTFVYAGSLKKIRGFDMLVKAFNQFNDPSIILKIYARGATENEVEELKHKFRPRSIRVDVIGGWLSKRNIELAIASADITVLPFLLIPSELPVTVMESIALGTPVIVSNVAGLPEFAGRAGLVVEAGSVSSLAGAIQTVHCDHDLLHLLRKHCYYQKDTYLAWEEVALRWLSIIRSE